MNTKKRIKKSKKRTTAICDKQILCSCEHSKLCFCPTKQVSSDKNATCLPSVGEGSLQSREPIILPIIITI